LSSSRSHAAVAILWLVCGVFAVRPALSQEVSGDVETLKKTAPRVYLDCSSCDIDYIRTEITFVNYVRDRNEAQVHLLITTQRTGSGGREYTLFFFGQNEFAGRNDTLKYFSNTTDTEDEIRRGLVRVLKIGLMSYVARTPISSRVAISYSEKETAPAGRDRWNYWVFSLSADGYFSGEQSYHSKSLEANFSANRVTPELKIRLGFSSEHFESHYEIDDETIDSVLDSLDFNGMVVKSLNEHWSVGGYLKVLSSSFENIKFSISPAPAVEYNVLPYSQSARRQLRLLYTLSFNARTYREVTIYDKTSQNLWSESLSITLDVKEKWGSVGTTQAGSHYFYDFSKYHLSASTAINWQVVRGLSFFAAAGGSRIHDQIFLPKGEATLEEILLQLRQLETGYSYFVSVGLSYTFGSIFTNVVNPRFGSQGSSGISISFD
jgi:hypothetical protein